MPLRFPISTRKSPSRRSPLRLTCMAVFVLGTSACATDTHGRREFTGFSFFKPKQTVEVNADIYRRAEFLRAERLMRENERLKKDLHQAEQALVSIESGLRGIHRRADAVSALAEARIQLENAAARTRWREDDIQDARQKLEESRKHIQAGLFGASIFFSARVQRVAQNLNQEADTVDAANSVKVVLAERVNLRAGPSTRDTVLEVLLKETPVFPEKQIDEWVLVRTTSGVVGWVYARLLRAS